MENWNGFKRLDFEFEGREALLIMPEEKNKTDKWLLKTEYFDAFQNYELLQVKRGWHLAFIKNKNRWCLDEDLDLKKRFADYLSEKYGLCKQCVPVGMSCGGLIAVKFAAKYPQYVSCLYLDAPVLNLLSCPADLGKANSGLFEEFTEATGMTISELICYREHPIDKLPVLIKNNIPVVLVYGKDDTTVPYSENGAILEKYYNANGGKLLVIGKDNCAHHPHGLEDPSVIADFVESVCQK